MRKPRIDTSRKADIRAVCGGSGSGKSSYVKAELKKLKPSRVIIWDPVDEYGELANVRVTCRRELVDILRRYPHGALKIRFVAEGQSDFEFWAKCAFAWTNAAVVAEETADVTSPSKAPPNWGKLIRRGRARGLAPIFALTQRPAESDKTAIGNATLIRVGRMARNADRAMMAKELDIDSRLITALLPLDFIERDMNTNKVRSGNLTKRKTSDLATKAG
ncbi:hypothetical protein [Shewanella subflava]|uniref:Helicase HerA central domain-containing protein n=1 Tax=Shewanella subflava TaxID=2986476 RepID=A0ABT3ICY4_9GAMM|nr:hypothetical protein [Shewanella subflava]MCW3173754.1 hypothetical protein [Shewanella subflava]